MHESKPVIAYHLILSAYGFWLPNDPRGSWSEIVRNPNLHEFGEATKVDTRHSVAGIEHDRAKRIAAKEKLEYDPVVFNGLQARAVARGFENYAEKSNVIVWACSVMPDHAHLVIARHRYEIEKIGNLIKGEATKQLVKENLHPFQDRKLTNGKRPPCFARKWWVVYLITDDDVIRTIEYVRNNPIKAGFKPQSWPFVKPYNETNG